MTCRGCDTPIDSDTYCDRCLDEVESLIHARPFVFPRWAIITRNVLCCLLLFLLVAWIFIEVGLLTPDTQY